MSDDCPGMLVVGSISDHGLAIARAGADDGYRVVLCGPAAGGDGPGKGPGAPANGGSGPWQWVRAALTDESAIAAALDAALARLGDCHVVVCDSSAGPVLGGPLAELDLADWQAAIEARLTTPYLIIRHLLWELMAQGGGAQVLMLTADDGATAPGAATLTAVEGFARSVAREYGSRRLRCNAIAVGRGADGDGADERVAAAARFLWSAEAAYVDGTLLKLG